MRGSRSSNTAGPSANADLDQTLPAPMRPVAST
jgi:hypothetical protein